MIASVRTCLPRIVAVESFQALEWQARQMAKCKACQHGPDGIEGHGDLFAQTMDGRRMQFLCRSCGAFWARHYSGSGTFDWKALDAEQPGTAVPGRGHQP